MKKNKIFILLFLFCFISQAREKPKITFEIKQRIVLPAKLKFNKTFVGGLSGLLVRNDKLYAVTDDRGRFGPPRIYEFKIKKQNTEFKLDIAAFIALVNSKNNPFRQLDFEALEWYNDTWILSSEGNLNAKPRVNPEIFSFPTASERKTNKSLKPRFVEISEEFLTPLTGVRTRGLKNNMAFEGMTKDQEHLYLMSESSLLQDKETTENISSYLLVYNLRTKSLEQKYKLYFDTGAKFHLYFGVSEITYWKEKKFFILTRGVNLSAELGYDCQLWLLDLEHNENDILQPSLIFDFKQEKMEQNYEGMAFYKEAQDEYLIVVSDDNFNKLEKTEFIFFKVK